MKFELKITDDDNEVWYYEITTYVPSDMFIERASIEKCGGMSYESIDERVGFISGAKWMRKQLMNLIRLRK